MAAAPLERFYNLAVLSDAGYETVISATEDERRGLAEWAGVEEVSRLQGRIAVWPQSKTRFAIETEFEADIVQSCVVTLAPVHSRIARSFTRILHLAPGAHRFADRGGLVAPDSLDEEAPDEIERTRYDLATPLREELALAIDPYPRAPGVGFDAPDDAEDQPDSPFAVLEKLKRSS